MKTVRLPTITSQLSTADLVDPRQIFCIDHHERFQNPTDSRFIQRLLPIILQDSDDPAGTKHIRSRVKIFLETAPELLPKDGDPESKNIFAYDAEHMVRLLLYDLEQRLFKRDGKIDAWLSSWVLVHWAAVIHEVGRCDATVPQVRIGNVIEEILSGNLPEEIVDLVHKRTQTNPKLFYSAAIAHIAVSLLESDPKIVSLNLDEDCLDAESLFNIFSVNKEWDHRTTNLEDSSSLSESKWRELSREVILELVQFTHDVHHGDKRLGGCD